MDEERMKQYLVERIRPGDSYASLLRFPSYFEIETIHACNARCIMCPGMDDSRPRGPMDSKLYTRLIEQISQHHDHVRRVSLFRDGEPLMDHGLEERVAEAKDAGIRCVSITSNMSLMTETRAVGLLEAGLNIIDMSIDGHSKDVFESIRRGLRFEKVRKNALQFIRLRDKIAPDCVIRIRMVLQDVNRHQWDEFHAFWTDVLGKRDTVLYHHLHNWGGKLDDATQRRLTLPCVSLWSLLIVHVDGKTVPLCTGNDMSAGSVKEMSLEDLWHAPIFEDIRRAHLQRERPVTKSCSNCLAWAPSSHTKNIDDIYLES